MPPPPPPRFNPNRDYVLLNDAADADAAAEAEEGGAAAAGSKHGGAAAARLFALSRPEALTISHATVLLLIASVAQVRQRGCLFVRRPRRPPGAPAAARSPLGRAAWMGFFGGGGGRAQPLPEPGTDGSTLRAAAG